VPTSLFQIFFLRSAAFQIDGHLTMTIDLGWHTGRTMWSSVLCSRLLKLSSLSRRARGAWRRIGATMERHSMPLYEHVFLARQDLSQQQVDELTNHYRGVIEQMGGSVPKVEYWGVKSLTYRIRKNRKAHFTLLNVDAPAAAVGEVERQQHINEDVLRALTVRVDELEAGPSAMMRKVDRERDRDERRGERRRDRDDRGDRGGRGREDRGGDETEMTEH
jgi:small subunit ribosomal protein S6